MILTPDDAKFLRSAKIQADFWYWNYSLADYFADLARHLASNQVFEINPAFWEIR